MKVISLLLFIFGVVLFTAGLIFLITSGYYLFTSISDTSGLSLVGGVVALIISIGLIVPGWIISARSYRKLSNAKNALGSAQSHDPTQTSQKKNLFID